MDHAESYHYDSGLHDCFLNNIQIPDQKFYYLFFIRIPRVEFLLPEHDNSIQVHHKRWVSDQEGLYSEGRAGPFRDCVRIGQFWGGADTIAYCCYDTGKWAARRYAVSDRAISTCNHVHTGGGVDIGVSDGLFSGCRRVL
jgi:hypothetical protein